MIVIDPRVTDSAAQADLHLQGKPGEDPAILAGIARILIEENLIDHAPLTPKRTDLMR